ncbi:profilin [Mytilus galloprovincialis]|uniref:Profilin n=1 Tax=Mytilus galloprovincialis TaxID=29158 RepID=A0A8B6BX96_MYTGA|nr:profilin [Mytilus galloprovincialis]
MSWDGYIDNIIARSKDVFGVCHVDKACIIGINGKLWTTAGNANAIKLKQDEAYHIANCFKAKDFSLFITCGVVAEGLKYFFLKEDDGKIVYAKLKNHGALTFQCSKTSIIIAHTDDGYQLGSTNKAVYGIAKYLESRSM